jgi:hypothetical protein
LGREQLEETASKIARRILGLAVNDITRRRSFSELRSTQLLGIESGQRKKG